MQERSYVALGFVPMVVGLVALGVMRRPEAVVARASIAAVSDASAEDVDSLDDAADTMLGVIVAGHTADLGAEIGGSVVKVFVREGARVREGDPLVYIDSAAATSEARMAQAELAQQMSALSRARADHRCGEGTRGQRTCGTRPGARGHRRGQGAHAPRAVPRAQALDHRAVQRRGRDAWGRPG
jgi:multidrug efflux pump subunit AcrA (membrane-fusion protein)